MFYRENYKRVCTFRAYLNAVETKTKRFAGEISTDGYGVSVLLKKEIQFGDFEIVDETEDIVKCDCGMDMKKNGLKRHVSGRLHIKRMSEKRSGLQQNIDINEYDRIVGIDPLCGLWLHLSVQP